MLLLDSNIIIYSALPEYSFLRDYYFQDGTFASAISKVEVLGYHKITSGQIAFFNEIFSVLPLMPVDSNVIDKAVALRRERNLSLGDSLIAATALVYGLTVITRNIDDFSGVSGLAVENPIK